ncbi:hypothetical protein Droror1_Dr00018026 [Drosera rotundifolia]
MRILPRIVECNRRRRGIEGNTVRPSVWGLRFPARFEAKKLGSWFDREMGSQMRSIWVVDYRMFFVDVSVTGAGITVLKEVLKALDEPGNLELSEHVCESVHVGGGDAEHPDECGFGV